MGNLPAPSFLNLVQLQSMFQMLFWSDVSVSVTTSIQFEELIQQTMTYFKVRESWNYVNIAYTQDCEAYLNIDILICIISSMLTCWD